MTAALPAQQTPTPAAAEWWRLTTALSNDSMRGRDTGSEDYERAARYVADQFKAARLLPAGDNGTYFQRVPMHQIDLDVAHSSIAITGTRNGAAFEHPLRLLYETTLVPRPSLPASLHGDLVFTGYGTDAKTALRGKIAVFYNNIPASLSQAEREGFAARRLRELTQAGAVAAISIDNPAAIEPTHWPAAYARSVTLAGSTPPDPAALLVLRISAEAAPKLFSTVSEAHPFAEILRHAKVGEPLSDFPLDVALQVKLAIREKDISSTNILAIYPGADARRATTANPAVEYVAMSAHLDGYGFGTLVDGDRLYNGALDDAAYVATLLEFAHILQAYAPKRSLLYCIFTGEEKGLLGSQYFTQHLTVPKDSIIADLNLDQLRPIFPLKILTMEGLNDSTLGDTARTLAKKYDIELRPERELERNLFRRADNYSFVKIGVPIASFIFGYNPGTPEERIYRDWYARRYHKPQDDLSTPIDWAAAVKFNNFFEALALAVANAPSRPLWKVSSLHAPVPTVALFSHMGGCEIVHGKIAGNKCH